MAANHIRRKLAAILAADAVGFSRLMGEDEEGTMRVLSAHRAVIDGVIEFHGGRIVGTAGDSVLAEFGSPVEAVRCAVEIQNALKTRNNSLPEAQRLHFRIGVNLGDVMIKGDDLLGDGVNVAARLEGIAEPGGICVSSSVYDQIAGKLDLGFVEMGEQSLKNIQRPIRVYRVTTGVAAPKPALPPRSKARGAWVYAAGGAAVVLVAIAAVLRLREAPPAPVTVAAPAIAPEVEAQRAQEVQRALEAQRSAEDRAKAEIAAANARADAEIAKARAESEVARARAETENARRQAAADLAAARARQAEMRPPAAPAAAPVAPAPVTPASAVPAPPPVVAAARSAGWSAQRTCEPFMELAAFTDQIPVYVIGDEFTLERGQTGLPGYFTVRGKPQGDGTLVLTGYAISGASAFRGQKMEVFWEGRLDGDRYAMKGRYGARACALTIVRKQS